MTVKDRLLIFVKHTGLSQGKFERKANLSNGYINNMTGGIQSGSLEKIRKAFPLLNTDWLLYDKGQMLLKTPDETFEERKDSGKRDIREPPAKNYNDQEELIRSLKQTIAAQEETIKQLKIRIEELVLDFDRHSIAKKVGG